MKRFRILSVIILIVAIASAAFFKYKDLVETDRLGPVVTAPTDVLEVSIEDGEDALKEGVTAKDIKDGDVTGSIVIEDISGFLDDDRRIVSYAAFDSDNHVGKATRQIRYTDYTSPRFNLDAPFMFPVGRDTDFLEHLSATDCMDGDITSELRFSKGYSLHSDTVGDYQAQFEVTNSAGDTALLPVTVTIYDTTSHNQAPQLTLNQYITYTVVGERPNLRSFIEEAVYRGEEIPADDISIEDGTVDYNTPGTYEVVYSAENEDGDIGRVRLIVVVTEE